MEVNSLTNGTHWIFIRSSFVNEFEVILRKFRFFFIGLESFCFVNPIVIVLLPKYGMSELYGTIKLVLNCHFTLTILGSNFVHVEHSLETIYR